MPHNQAVYEALNNLQLSDEKEKAEKAEKQKKALAQLVRVALEKEDLEQLAEKFRQNIYEHRDILGLNEQIPDIGNDDDVKKGDFISLDGVEPDKEKNKLIELYNLALQKHFQVILNTLTGEELRELTGKVKENDYADLKTYLKDTLSFTKNIAEDFLTDASFKAIGQAAKEHLEQRDNEIKPVTEKKDEINQKLTELNNEFNTFKTQEEINQKITAIQKLIEEQNQRIESVEQLPYFWYDNKLREKVKEAKEAIKQNEQAIEEIKEKQKKLQEIVEGLQKAKKETNCSMM